MIEALSATPENLLGAAKVARKGGHDELACTLAEDAVTSAVGPAPATLVGAAQLLLDIGEEGRVITMLDRAPAFEDDVLRGEAAELRARAAHRLRLAKGPAGESSCGPTDRAHTLAVEAILSGAAEAGGSVRADGIAIVVSSLGPGGAQTQLVHILSGLCDRKSDVGPVTLLITSRAPADSEFRAADIFDLDITVEQMCSFESATGEMIAAEDAERLSVLHPRTAKRTMFLLDRLRAHRPKAVLSMSYSFLDAVLAASLAGVPRVVVSARGGVPVAGSAPDRLLTAAYRAALIRDNFSLVTNSEATANAFRERLGRSAGEIPAVSNGVDVDALQARLNPEATEGYRRALAIPAGARVVGSVFRHVNIKRPDLWMRAAALVAARLPDAVFVLVGPGFHVDQLEAAGVPSELVGRFRMPGVKRDVPGWMGMMDVVLLTSASEGTPNVLLEAQALGKPVVTSAVGGTGETFLPGQTGLLLSPSPSPEEVAGAVIEVMEDPGYAVRARELGPDFVRRSFGIERMVDELVDVCFPHGAP